MKIRITPTPDITRLDGVECRRWAGRSDRGVECHVFVVGLIRDSRSIGGQLILPSLEIEPTAEIVHIDVNASPSVLCRRWLGSDRKGGAYVAYVHRIAVDERCDQSEFERELLEQTAPEPPQAIDLRMVL